MLVYVHYLFIFEDDDKTDMNGIKAKGAK